MPGKCLTINASDCLGGAGIQADLKTFSAYGVYGASVITSVAAANKSRVISAHNVPVKEVEAQIDAVFEDIEVDSVKLGTLPTVEMIGAAAAKLRVYKPKFIVCDPALFAAGVQKNAAGALIELIFPIADIVTPNIVEAEEFLGGYIGGIPDMEEAARILCEYGAKAALVRDAENSVDVLFDGKEYTEFAAGRGASTDIYGADCTLSAAIAAGLALGRTLAEAVRNAESCAAAF